jgi:2,4-dienoyl-CoA reductase-like NADH-dependent reductase (Old Yellow Enzyme family)
MADVNRVASPLILSSGSTLKNRIAKAAMSERLAGEKGRPSSKIVRLYSQWSAGGAGLIMTGNIMCSSERSLSPGVACIEDAFEDEFKKWSAAGKENGARIWAQLNHPGRQIPKKYVAEPLAPSAVRLTRGGWAFGQPREMSEDDVERLIASFALAAVRAQRFGFDGVQIHAAHGYLISQFLSPVTNQRSDRWGGTAEGRRRFLLETVRRVRKDVDPGFSVGVKLNSADFQKGGLSEDESMGTIEALNQEGVDLLEISGGTYERAANIEVGPAYRAGDGSGATREAYFLRFAEQARSVALMPLMVTGGFRTLVGMNSAIASGAVDVVGLARPLAVQPDACNDLVNGIEMNGVAKPRRTGLKMLDTIVEVQWYASQIALMGSGIRTNPSLSYRSQVVKALRKYL